MANSRKSVKKSGTVAQFPQPENAIGVEDVPESFQEQPVAQSEPPNPPPKNPLKKKTPSIPTEGDFFTRVAAIPRQDWDSQRIYLYLYILEPLCNLKQSGGKAYLNRYSQPVRDEHQIAVEYGSGRYRLMLAYNKVSPDESTEVARYEFEIFNPQYPPKVPKAAWINDSRNAKWEALLPKEPVPGAATAASTIVDAMKMVSDIRRDVRDEMDTGDEPQQNSTSEMLQTMKAAKDLFAPPAAAPAAPAQDPLQIAVKLAETMMQMKADNPVIDMYRDELKALRDELKEERAEARKAAPVVAPKGMVEQLKELASISDSLTPLKTLFGFGNGTSEAPVRAGRTGALDVIQTLGTKFFESDLASGVGQWLGAMAQRSVQGNGAPPQMSNPINTHLQPQNEQQQFAQFIEQTLNPALRRFYSQGLSGGDFAGWLYDAFPDRLQQLQNFTHPLAPGMKGAQVIVAAYKRTPEMWSLISALREGEPSFVQFVNEFCRWKPESSEQSDVIDAEIVHEGEDGEGEPERVS